MSNVLFFFRNNFVSIIPSKHQKIIRRIFARFSYIYHRYVHTGTKQTNFRWKFFGKIIKCFRTNFTIIKQCVAFGWCAISSNFLPLAFKSDSVFNNFIFDCIILFASFCMFQAYSFLAKVLFYKFCNIGLNFMHSFLATKTRMDVPWALCNSTSKISMPN